MTFFDTVSFRWKALNDVNFHNAKCIKILSNDPCDEIVDLQSSLCVGVAAQHAKNKYDSDEWKQFYKSLIFVFDQEQKLYDQLDKDDLE